MRINMPCVGVIVIDVQTDTVLRAQGCALAAVATAKTKYDLALAEGDTAAIPQAYLTGAGAATANRVVWDPATYPAGQYRALITAADGTTPANTSGTLTVLFFRPVPA